MSLVHFSQPLFYTSFSLSSFISSCSTLSFFTLTSIFFFNDTATTEIYTLSLHDALPILIDVVGDDADLRLAGRHQPRAVRSDQLDAGILDERPSPHHVVKGNPLGDANDELDAGGRRFHDRIGGEGSWDEDAADVSAGLALRVGHRVKDWDAEMRAATLARADAGDQVGTVGLHLLGVE